MGIRNVVLTFGTCFKYDFFLILKILSLGIVSHFTSVACAIGPSVITPSTGFFLPKPGLLEFI